MRLEGCGGPGPTAAHGSRRPAPPGSHHEAPREARSFHPVMAGLDPAIPLRRRMCSPDRDHRDKPGDDGEGARRFKAIDFLPICL